MPSDLIPYVTSLLALALTIGAIVAYRSGYSKEARGLQAQTIDALRSRIEVLEAQLENAVRDALKDKAVIRTVQYALARRGLHIEINGEYITLVDEQSAQSRTTIPINLEERKHIR